MKALSIVIMITALIPLTAVTSMGVDSKGEDYSADLDYAQVTYVKASQGGDGSWCISATVRHNDEGFDHYANGWQVLDEDDNEIAWRLLTHPHDNEQPFTRELCDIEIPQEVRIVIVRAKCKVHGFGGFAVEVDLSKEEGEKFKVIK